MHILKALAEVQASNGTHIWGSTAILSADKDGQPTLSSRSPSVPAQLACVSLKVACVYAWLPGFWGCHREDAPLGILALVASGACIHSVNGATSDEESF